MSTFSDFQKSEYQHIAEAHFKAIESISSFFRYYLLVMSLPISVFAILLGLFARSDNVEKSIIALFGFSSLFLIIVGVVGFCVMIHIVNLKMDVTLYSRVVNSIRKYFYDEHGVDHANKLLMRQLPQSAHLPPYRDIPFGFVILAFAISNASYISLGVHLFLLPQFKTISSIADIGLSGYGLIEALSIASLFLFAIAIHFIAYWFFSRYREFSYLRGSSIGIDIDGVLNKHRENFCELLAAKIGKRIHPDEIKLLPVHENTELSEGVTRDDERRIFNDPVYWTEMPEMEGAAEAIKSIRGSFLLPIHIFTHRPWPDTCSTNYIQEERGAMYKRRWQSAANDMVRQANAKLCEVLWVWFATKLDYRRSMKYITKYWLQKSGIAFDSLLVERGNENIIYARGRYENRFNYAKRKKVRFFVEDDWIKALKLSYICDIVFLISHPYNRPGAEDPSKHAHEFVIGRLPANVIRVDSWREIKRIIGQLV